MQHFQVIKIIRKEFNNKWKPGIGAYFNQVVDNNGGKIALAVQHFKNS